MSIFVALKELLYKTLVNMNKYLPLAAGVLMLAACSQQPSYKISGNVHNPELDGKYVYLTAHGSQSALDSAIVTNGKFTFEGAVDTPKVSTLSFAPGETPRGTFATTLILENGKITADLDTFSTAKGTPDNDNLALITKQMRELQEAAVALGNTITPVEEGKISEEDMAKVEAAEKKAFDAAENYVRDHLNDLSGAYILVANQYYIPEESLIDIASQSGDLFKSYPAIGKLMNRIEILKNVAVGNQFVDFEMTDMKDNAVKLSDYVGNDKVALIDFWASWCPPCRASIPGLKKVYEEYKDKGFEIVGVSLDSKKDAWEKGVSDLQIPWPQMSDLKGWQNAGAALYGVNSIPHTVLVDKDGKIVAKNIHGVELTNKLDELLK
jgi:thiol-disulfide isomerase/thioredoxin